MMTELMVIGSVTFLIAIGSFVRSSAPGRRIVLGLCGAGQIIAAAFVAGMLSLHGSFDCASCAWAEETSSGDAVAVDVKPSDVSLAPAAPIIPPGRPSWIAEAQNIKPGDHWVVAKAGPYVTREEADRELTTQVKAVTDNYINDYLGSKYAASLLRYDGEQIRKRLIASDDIYADTIQVSVGPMEQIHAKVEFPEWFRDELKSRWRQVTMGYRIGQVGLVAAVFLGLLSTAFGYFKANTATGGRRSTNLQFGAAAAILLIVVAGVAVSYKFLYWL